MDDELTYQEIEGLERKLVELRSRLSARINSNWKPPVVGDHEQAAQSGEPFVIRSSAELEMLALPDLARLIFDALPVQIFIKEHQVCTEKGARKYLYLNKAARDLKSWSRADVPSKYDVDIFPNDERGKALYASMQSQESQTLNSGASRITSTDWVQGSGTWSRNQNIEIPILDKELRTIGFCSIANDIVFRELPREWAIHQELVQHRYRNLLTKIEMSVADSASELEEIIALSGAAAGKAVLVRRALLQIQKSLKTVDRTSEVQVAALTSMGRRDGNSWGESTCNVVSILEQVKDIYSTSELRLDPCCFLEGHQSTSIREPMIITAIITILVNNAMKYSRLEDGSMDCSVVCRVDGGHVIWEVSNTCGESTRVMDLSLSDRPELGEVTRGGFDRFMIWTFLRHAFPGREPHEVFQAKKPADDRYTVILITEIDFDVAA